MQVGGRWLGVHLGNRSIVTVGGDPGTGWLAAPGLSALLARVGDPVPVRTAAGPRSAADLVAAHLADALAPHGPPDPGVAVVVTVPGHWRGHRRAALARAAAAAGLGPLTSVGSALAVAASTAPATELPDPALIAVLEVGEDDTSAAVVRIAGRTVDEVAPPAAPLPWGLADAEDALLAQALDRLPGAVVAAAAAELRAACRSALPQLCAEPAATLPWAGEPVPIDRTAWADALRVGARAATGHLRDALHAAGVPVAELTGVLLAGPGARLPLVAEAVAAELGVVPVVPAEPETAAARGAAVVAQAAAEQAPPAPAPEVAAELPGGRSGSARHRRPVPSRAGRRRLAAVPLLVGTLLLGGSGAVPRGGPHPDPVGAVGSGLHVPASTSLPRAHR